MKKIPASKVKSNQSKPALPRPIRIDPVKGAKAFTLVPGQCAMRVNFAALEAAIIRD